MNLLLSGSIFERNKNKKYLIAINQVFFLLIKKYFKKKQTKDNHNATGRLNLERSNARTEATTCIH